jgi:hypothetical protein
MRRARVALALWVVWGGALGWVGPACAEDADAFESHVAAVYGQYMRADTTIEKLEQEYLDLLRLPLSPEQRGVVFSKMASMYASPGGREYSDTAATYCEETLSYPLAADVAGDVYVCWATALQGHYRDWRGARYPIARRRIMAPVLAGLRLVLDAGAPAQPVQLPSVDMYSVLGPRAVFEKRHAEQMAARKKAEALYKLHDSRRALVDACTWLYRQPPADPDELQRLLTQALPKYPDVVQQIMTELKKGK